MIWGVFCVSQKDFVPSRPYWLTISEFPDILGHRNLGLGILISVIYCDCTVFMYTAQYRLFSTCFLGIEMKFS